MSKIEVDFRRPPMRFGSDVLIHQQDPVTGKRVLLQQQDGELIWVEVRPDIDIKPTFHLDDEILQALTEAWLESGDRKISLQAEDILLSQLDDTKTIRDRLLTIIENEHKVPPS